MSIASTSSSSRLRRTTAIVAAGLLTAALSLGGALTAQAATGQLASSATTATPGGTVTLTATDFKPNTALQFTLDADPLTTFPVNGGAATTDASGKYVGTATIPSDLAVGGHFISVLEDGNDPGSSAVEITVVAQPTSSVTPATQALSSYLKNGVTATFSGFTPGATVSFGIATPGTGDQAGPDAVADAAGTVTLRFVPEVGTNYANAGEYFLSAFSNAGAIRAAQLTFAVTADSPAPAPAPIAAPATPVKRAATFTG